ncbi:MAG: phosphoenolpyruvate--protein phosphotransferase [Haloarculaceae archaeon]
MTTHRGTGVTPLSGVGTARWYAPATEFDLPDEPRGDPESEAARLAAAREAVDEALAADRDRARERVGDAEADIFDALRQFLTDPQLLDPMAAAVDEGVPAERAVADAFADAIAQFEAMEGRMAERADDLRELRDRLLRELLAVPRASLESLPPGTVILAERLTPGDTVELDPEAVAGVATVAGGRTSHAAIIARSLAIPAVVGVGESLRDVADGTRLLVDGRDGRVVIDPEETDVTVREVPVREERVSTTDDREIAVAANVGSGPEVEAAAGQGADGVGLYRSEFLFLDREAPPDEDEQREAYAAALSAFPGERVVVRTLDVGGDKQVPYLDLPAESNPFLGKRGIRLSLDEHRALFETQLRALLRANAEGDGTLAVMFPMVATVEELDAALATVESVATDLETADVPSAVPELGAMVETPAAALNAAALAERVDFLSLGTNDLTQYVMAADRENAALADLSDPLHPPVLRAIRETVEGGHAGDAWVGMCGEMAGDPDLTELLVGLGLDELSASAVTVPAIKERVPAVDAGDASALAERALACETRTAVRDLLSV